MQFHMMSGWTDGHGLYPFMYLLQNTYEKMPVKTFLENEAARSLRNIIQDGIRIPHG
jgi:3-oxoacyl-ACP reductase-like protein